MSDDAFFLLDPAHDLQRGLAWNAVLTTQANGSRFGYRYLNAKGTWAVTLQKWWRCSRPLLVWQGSASEAEQVVATQLLGHQQHETVVRVAHHADHVGLARRRLLQAAVAHLRVVVHRSAADEYQPLVVQALQIAADALRTAGLLQVQALGRLPHRALKFG